MMENTVISHAVHRYELREIHDPKGDRKPQDLVERAQKGEWLSSHKEACYTERKTRAISCESEHWTKL